MTVQTKRKLCGAGIAVGGLLCLSPLFGLLGTVMGMNRAFATLGAAGVGDPNQLSGDIGMVLKSTMLGIVLAPIGLVMLIISLVLLLRTRTSVPPPPLPE